MHTNAERVPQQTIRCISVNATTGRGCTFPFQVTCSESRRASRLLRLRSRLCLRRAAAAGNAPLVRFTAGAAAKDRRLGTSSMMGSLSWSRLFRRRAAGSKQQSLRTDMKVLVFKLG